MTVRALPLLALFLPLPAHAQDMLPLRDEVAGGAPMSYIGTRCAAFYASSAAYLGDQISAEMHGQVDDIVALLVMTAVNAMEQDGQPREAAREAATAEVVTLSEAYHARFEASAAAGQNAFADDPLYLADNADCTSVMTAEE